jgi:hypothetical protein
MTATEFKTMLRERIRERNAKPVPFRPCAFYNGIGDFIEAYTEDADAFAVPVPNSNITLMHAMSDNRIVGFKIYRVKKLLQPKGETMSKLRMMSAAPLAAQQEEFDTVVHQSVQQLGITDFATFLRLIQLVSTKLPEIMALAATVQEVVAKIVALWKEVNPTPTPGPNVP